MVEELIYVNNTSSAFINKNNQFIYEVCVFCKVANYYSLIDRAYYISDKELKIVRTFQYGPDSLIRCELYSAPFAWLMENQYYRYIAPAKKKRIVKPKNDENVKPEISVNKSSSGGTIRKAGRPRTKKL